MHPLTAPTRPQPWARALGVATALALLMGGAGCGGDDGDARAAAQVDLLDALGFLRDDLGLSDAEVACVADDLREAVGDDGDLAGLAGQLRQVDAGDVAVTDLSGDAGTLLTEALSRCSGT